MVGVGGSNPLAPTTSINSPEFISTQQDQSGCHQINAQVGEKHRFDWFAGSEPEQADVSQPDPKGGGQEARRNPLAPTTSINSPEYINTRKIAFYAVVQL